MSVLKTLPLVPLRGAVVFPNMTLHLDVGRSSSVKALEDAMLKDNKIILAAQKKAHVEDPVPKEIYKVGTTAMVKQILKLPGGTIRALVEGLERVKIKKYVASEPFFEVEIEEIEEELEKSLEAEALMRSVLFQFEQYIKLSKRIPPETLVTVSTIEEPGTLADVISSNLSLQVSQKQVILEAGDPVLRLKKLVRILSKEMEVLEIERKINLQVRRQMEKTQKEYYLREQVKAIHKELGEKDERMAEADELREKIAEINLPEEVEEKALKEVERLEKMPPAAAEGVIVRNYLEWLLSLPWGVQTKDRLDLDMAEKILDEDHYGLKKVKERIIEYLAVRQLTEKIKGPIICLIGPPGVGKTSLAKSVARALERKFIRMSLGGVRDEAEIRGHRRTYVGAMPGRIIQGMRQAGSNNPVFILDEIDKMSTDFRGDPSAALLEVLDPEQNSTFSDHYIEVPFDLSNVMFITTANSLFNIPRPLQDRMETIFMSGYTEEEKVKIAERYLLPKQLKENGLTAKNLSISETALRRIIRQHTREAGVRGLERQIASICRKTARATAKNRENSTKISLQNLTKFIGVPRYRYGLAEKADEAGVATGLAWTESGGDTLSIEVTLMSGKGKLILTGKLGDVMQESAKAALSFIRTKAATLGIEGPFHEEKDIHIHIPEGAIPKDGPSAGISMATALISALTGTPVRREVAMTGEITLRGKVLPVGGIKEKVLAAHRAGIKKIVLPLDNKKDITEIPQNVRRRLEIVYVEHMGQVLKEALVAEKK